MHELVTSLEDLSQHNYGLTLLQINLRLLQKLSECHGRNVIPA